MIKIIIADDHPIVRRGLRQILAAEPDMQVLDEAESADGVMAVIGKRPDVLVMDITMPGRTGLDALRDIRQMYPQLPVLMLSIHPEDQYAMRALRAGAAGYLTKESAPEELVKAIRKVVGGGKYIGPSLAEKLAEQLGRDPDKAPHESLSDREYSVLCMIASGKTVGQIADDLSLSVKTVSTYRARILEKMGLNNNAELTHYAIRHHLVE